MNFFKLAWIPYKIEYTLYGDISKEKLGSELCRGIIFEMPQH